MFRSKTVAWVSAVALLPLAAPSARAAEAGLDATPRTVVMSAFPPERETLLAHTADRKEYRLNGKSYVTGRLAGKEVVLVLSGISMVNAAMTAQQAVDRFTVKAIVYSGIAGGVDPALALGDVVVPGQWGEYLESVMAREVDGRFVPPPFFKADDLFPNFGMMIPSKVEVSRDGLGEPEHRFWFPVDAGLLDVARRVAGGMGLENCDTKGQCLSHRPKVVVGGNGVSGQSFVDNARFRAYAFDTFKAQVLDMESAAVAHVAYANGVPFIAFRSLSDLAGGSDAANEMDVFFTLASANAAKVVLAFLAAMP